MTQAGDASEKRAKVEQEGATSSRFIEAGHSAKQHVVSARLQPTLESSSRFHDRSTGLDRLPKEMHEMKIQNERDNSFANEKVRKFSERLLVDAQSSHCGRLQHLKVLNLNKYIAMFL